MQYKLLIVEDEDMLRDALVHSIDWTTLGYEVREAQDGREALHIAREFEPDIVITDVRMPHMDGVQLSAELRKEMPQVVVAILSGHDEFAIAQQALRIGVREYATKPIRPEELVQLASRMASASHVGKSRAKQLSRMREQLDHSLPLLRERLLNRMIEQALPADEIADMLAFVELSLKGENFTVCVIEFEPDAGVPREDALLEYAAANLVQREVITDAVAFELDKRGVALIYCARTKDVERERTFVKQLLLFTCEALYEQLGIFSTAGMGVPVKSLSELHISYVSALEALSQRMLQNQHNVFDIYELQPTSGGYPFEELTQLMSRLRMAARPEWEAALSEFFAHIRAAGNLRDDALRVLMIDLLVSAERLLIEAGCEPGEADVRLFKTLLNARTLDEYQRLIEDRLLSVRDQFEESRSQSGQTLIDKVCQHILEHYMESEMSLNTVAKSMFISPTYLSILFKRKMGVTFSDFVISLRMDKAKQLLSMSSLRTYEVAARTGYNDPQYFSGCFKKNTGLTPTEYRAKARAQEDVP